MEPEGKPRGRRPVTIVDVAEHAGVALGTVSRYLNDRPMRESNRRMIADAIAALGYRRNAAAASMKSNKSQFVGLMVPSLGQVHARLIDDLIRLLRLRGRTVLLYRHEQDARSFADGLDFFANHRVDAVVMDGNEQLWEAAKEQLPDNVPVILFDNDLPGIVADRVLVDNRASSALLVEQIIAAGHRRIATVHGPLHRSVARDRLAGYKSALAAHNVPTVAEYICNGDWTEEGGYFAVSRLMALEAPPTAVFSANYNMTVGVLRWLRDNGLTIGWDISLASFDDVELFALHRPGITAVAQPVPRLAEAIAATIIARLEHPEAQQRHVALSGELMIRGSVASVGTQEAER
ncbi:LacI family transcriptional regulator [Devosia pacifica]|uniref:LacI family transcriptional regulator n=1 Tax=Devosia pacifica TaxID=1335967 RepID=A0A918SD69_9HYPH|nr:LacI family DNA-binding transcriptional regulator [Devosia pacifica]GHA36564.1 LacI family transcriptional regulator [Devosia pacifica]